MSFRGFACGAVVLLAGAAGQAEAAWNNAFQVSCFRPRERASYYYPTTPVIAHSAPVVAQSAPNPCCHTAYVQRCYYQPVTTYKTVCEPVTSYRTSHFWEPVCSYRTSCYIDPCTGCPVQVTQPVTSYRLRSQCNAVTSYVQRCVPVVSYRAAFRLEPVTVCPPPCPSPCGPGTGYPGGPNVSEPGYPGDPSRLPATPVPMIDESQQPGTPNSLKKPFRPDKVVSLPAGPATVRGQIVASNYVTPLRGAKVLFVSKQSSETKRDATADASGRFAVSLPEGGWQIYLSRRDGTLEFHSSIDVQESQNRNVMVVSR